ncbi:hypothetical protein OC842_007190 [Tilletia horrida]|uniref:Uncharacterized protein n=1 Tax=Tilletia horrida TaxID=155126 RepID=A0AAN6JH77_9BASI|nr:hypothetical protein OC842_007190 [Tilletia horrida]
MRTKMHASVTVGGDDGARGGSARSRPYLATVEELAQHVLASLNQGQKHGKTRARQAQSAASSMPVGKAGCAYLAWSFFLVAFGLRDAILVDEVRLSHEQQHGFLDALAASGPERKNELSDGAQAENRTQVQPLRPCKSCKLGQDNQSGNDFFVQAQPSKQPSPPSVVFLRRLKDASRRLAGWLLGYPVIYSLETASTSDISAPSSAVRIIYPHEAGPQRGQVAYEWEDGIANNLGGQPLHLFQAELVSAAPAHSLVHLLAFSVPVTPSEPDAGVPGNVTTDELQARVQHDLDRRRVQASDRLRDLLSSRDANAESSNADLLWPALDRFHHLLSGSTARVTPTQVTLPLVAL